MVISNIKLGFAQKKIAALPQKAGLFDEADTVKNICILLDEADMELVKRFKNLRKDLKLKEEGFKMLLCLSANPKQKDYEGLIFSPSDLNWRGKIKNTEIKELLGEKFDLLVSFTRQDSRTARIIATALNADLKVSRKEEKSLVFDLVISTKFEEADVFLTELKKYLKILNRIKE